MGFNHRMRVLQTLALVSWLPNRYYCKLVGMEGVEPPRLSAVDFESTTSAIPSHTHCCKFVDRGGTGSPTTCFKAGQAISCVRMRTWFD